MNKKLFIIFLSIFLIMSSLAVADDGWIEYQDATTEVEKYGNVESVPDSSGSGGSGGTAIDRRDGTGKRRFGVLDR